MAFEWTAAAMAAKAGVDLINGTRGSGGNGRYQAFLNNRAHATQWDQFSAEYERQSALDLEAKRQYNQNYAFSTMDRNRVFNQTKLENARDHAEAIRQYEQNRRDSNSQYSSNLAWSKEQYNRAEVERSRTIQTAVADAAKAGVHPLFALGATGGYQGGGTLPGQGSTASSTGGRSGYGSSSLPSPQGPGGTVSGSAGASSLQAIERQSSRLRGISNALSTYAEFRNIKGSEKRDALEALLTQQQIKESEHRMKMSEIEAQINQSGLARNAQRLNHTGEGRKATVEVGKVTTNERAEKHDLVDKRVVKDTRGKTYNVLSGPFDTKWRFPTDVDLGETGEGFAGELGALALGVGGIIEGLVSDSIDSMSFVNDWLTRVEP